jgi:uncharacterized protein YegJ (DUF2314 family)
MSWALEDAEERAAEAPRTFYIPPAELRHSLERGDEVKLIFRLERDDGEVAVERMWVEVVETDPYVGLLRNDPHLTGVIDFDDRVEFGPQHVCAYGYEREDLGYDAYGLCFLLKRVAQAEDPPALLLLEPDGDWQADADDETEEELAESENVMHWNLGYLTDRFPATADVLREGSKLAPRRGPLRRRRRDVWWRWQGDHYAREDR